MRRLVLTALLATAVLAPAGGGASARRVDAGAGVSAVLPAGWRLVHRSATNCSDPAQRLLATTARGKLHTRYRVPPRTALVLLMESKAGRVPVRPSSFHLPRLGTIGGCCEMPIGRGAELLFRDHGRRFIAFVYVGARSGARRDVLTLLNSLRVSAAGA
jgi:hypothetical protein